MKEKSLAETNKILVVKAGSYMYGTNTPESDEDFIGIFMPSEEYVFGFKKVDEVDMSIHDKNEDGRNTKDAVDIKYYEFRKFVKLAMENNPNILEILFVNQENIVFINDIGKRLLDNKLLFPFIGAKQKFLGYAFSQKHKMFVKRDNYFDLVKAKDFLDTIKTTDYRLFEIEKQMDKSVFIKRLNNVSGSLDYYGVGDINVLPSITIKTAKKIIEERLSKVGNREDLYLKHAYDTKFAMHLIRLMAEGVMLLATGKLEFPLDEKILDVLMSIRRGEQSIEQVLKTAQAYETMMDEINSPLSTKPRFEEIEKFVINEMKEFLK